MIATTNGPIVPLSNQSIEEAIEAWLKSAQGEDCLTSHILESSQGFPELRNRLRLAFLAGANYERRLREAKP